MRILIGSYVLFDSSQDRWALSDLSGDIARLIQVSSPIRADEIQTFYRGVKRTDISFTVSRPHADEAATLEHLLWEETRIPTDGVIQIEGPRDNGGPRTFYLRGRLETTGVRHIGNRSFCTYRLICGKPRLKTPTRD